MRKSDREITDIQEIEEILNNGKVCSIAFSDEGKPYVVPMNYGYRDRELYLHSALSGKKVDLARKNPRVCCMIYLEEKIVSSTEPCGWTCNYRSVIADGKVEFLSGEQEKSEALNVLMEHYAGKTFKFPAEAFSRVMVWRVSLSNITGKKHK